MSPDWSGEVRPTPVDAGAQVAALPRRTAHAVYALLAATADRHGPPLAREVAVFDEEASSAHSTAAALTSARRRGLAVCAGGGVWAATPLAGDLKPALEERFLKDTETELDAP